MSEATIGSSPIPVVLHTPPPILSLPVIGSIPSLSVRVRLIGLTPVATFRSSYRFDSCGYFSFVSYTCCPSHPPSDSVSAVRSFLRVSPSFLVAYFMVIGSIAIPFLFLVLPYSPPSLLVVLVGLYWLYWLVYTGCTGWSILVVLVGLSCGVLPRSLLLTLGLLPTNWLLLRVLSLLSFSPPPSLCCPGLCRFRFFCSSYLPPLSRSLPVFCFVPGSVSFPALPLSLYCPLLSLLHMPLYCPLLSLLHMPLYCPLLSLLHMWHLWIVLQFPFLSSSLFFLSSPSFSQFHYLPYLFTVHCFIIHHS